MGPENDICRDQIAKVEQEGAAQAAKLCQYVDVYNQALDAVMARYVRQPALVLPVSRK